MKKTLMDIDGALTAQHATDARPSLRKMQILPLVYTRVKMGHLGMGNKIVRLDVNGKSLLVDDTEYNLVLTIIIHPQPTQYNSNDYKEYKSLVAQTKVKSFPNIAMWKMKHMFRKMVIPGKR